jgi:hypothetical protein
MDEQTWARFSTVEPHCGPKRIGWIDRARLWARHTTFRTWPVFCLAIIVACGVMAFNVLMLERERFNHVMNRAMELKALDTSQNSIKFWLLGGHKKQGAHPRRGNGVQRGVLPGPGMPVSAFHWTFPYVKGVGKVPKPGRRQPDKRREPTPTTVLRLPIGVATALMRQRLKQEERAGVDFQRNIDWTLLKTLEQQVQDTAIMDTSTTHSLARLQKLLRWTQDAGVVTEVGPLSTSVQVKGHRSLKCQEEYMKDDPQCLSATILEEQLRRFRQSPLAYQDIMRYPFRSLILYRGTFKELKFQGQGIMFYQNGRRAYEGEWHGGSMHGSGVLFDQDGSQLWRGEFHAGFPKRSLLAAINNLFLWPMLASHAPRPEAQPEHEEKTQMHATQTKRRGRAS